MKASKLLIAVAITGIMSIAAPEFALGQDAGTQGGAAAGQASGKQRNWKDRTEYDLYVSITKETDPNKRLQLLQQWQDKYPTSDFKDSLRDPLFMQTYAQLNQPQQTIDKAKEILANDPTNFQALYFTTIMATQITPPTPDLLDQAEKAANGLIGAIPTQFAADKKPPQVKPEDWQKAQTDTDALAHTTLGWVAMNRKDYAKAEQEFTKSLQENPQAGQVSYWLGTVVLAEKDPKKQSAALYDFARAAAYDGQGSLNAAGRTQVQQYLTKAYTDYHGSTDGLPALLQMAKTSALPAADWPGIPSTADIEQQKAQQAAQFAQQHPELALWNSIKQALTAPDGETYFTQHMKDTQTPSFPATLISEEPAVHPKTLIVSIADGKTPDATIHLTTPLPGKAEPGTKIQFQGIPESYTATPFMVTFKSEKADIKDWPGKEAPVHHTVHHHPAS